MRMPQIRSQDIPLASHPPTCQFCQRPICSVHNFARPIPVSEALTSYYDPFPGSFPVNFASIELEGRSLSFVVIFKSL